MTPEQLKQFNDMQKRLTALEKVENISFIQNLIRRIDISALLSFAKLNDLGDVDTSGVTNGQVIKYTASSKTWENANDIDT